MKESEFDIFADEYERLLAQKIQTSGESPAFFANQKAEMTAHLTARSMPRARILDFGTGVGNSIAPLNRHFPSCAIDGVDVSNRSLDVARARFPGLASFKHFDGARIPADGATYDLAFASCVFHHIDHAEHERLLRELRRVVAPGGWLVIFEHNPFNPLTRHVVNTCEFDRNAHLLTAATLKAVVGRVGFRDVRAHYCVFFPHFLRALRPLERHMRWLPAGAQYCVVGRV